MPHAASHGYSDSSTVEKLDNSVTSYAVAPKSAFLDLDLMRSGGRGEHTDERLMIALETEL